MIVDQDAESVVRSTSFRGPNDAARRLPQREEVRVGKRDSHIARALRNYAAGDVHAFEAIMVDQPGTPFRHSVWSSMREIKFGDVLSYGELAEWAGTPRSYRAVGSACGENLAAPFVPCHRVVAAGGIGGYGYGLEVKRALLTHEKVSDPRIK